jgi:hypothetical protein
MFNAPVASGRGAVLLSLDRFYVFLGLGPIRPDA